MFHRLPMPPAATFFKGFEKSVMQTGNRRVSLRVPMVSKGLIQTVKSFGWSPASAPG